MKTSLGNRVFCSLIDPVGQVFCKDGKIFRLINEGFVEETLLLLKSGLIDELVREGIFPKTSISDIAIENYSLVLEHELIPVSYPYEWSPSMLKDAALLMININKIAEKYGYYLKDNHPWNILFRGQTPVFVDFGSFVKKDVKAEIDIDIDEFILSFILPLVLFQQGDYYLAHKLLLDIYSPGTRLLTSSMSKYLRSKVIAVFSRMRGNRILERLTVQDCNTPHSCDYRYNKYYIFKVELFGFFRLNLSGRLLTFLARKLSKKINFINFIIPLLFLENKMDKIDFKKQPKTAWKDYQNEDYFSEIPYRFEKILEITNNLNNIKTSLDIAGNHAYLSRLLIKLSKFEKLISMDYDISAIETAYHTIKKESININLIANTFLELTYNTDLIKRLRSDVVYGLALTHHLILSQKLEINTIFEVFYNLSNNYVFIEFMPLGLWAGDDTKSVSPPLWYNVDWFREHFLLFFELIEENQLEKNRILFCGKKSRKKYEKDLA